MDDLGSLAAVEAGEVALIAAKGLKTTVITRVTD
jgi:hypothetical protein